jgi:putative endopeptidase
MADTALAEIAGMTNSYDEHPLSNIRVNVSVQQSDKFMECYGVEEGDGMYLAPEDRVYIW